ncbi:Poly(A) polymerase I [Desulfarculales bacterium]
MFTPVAPSTFAEAALDQDINPLLSDDMPEPCVIPRSKHGISRKNIDPDALRVLYRLQRHGFLAYLVGGSVRDLLLGKKPKDFDVSTDAHPNQVHRLFRNSRIIGRRFRLVQVFFPRDKLVEVSTFRKLSDQTDDAVLQANNTFGTPAEDALRRDLTINALFYNIADFSVVDYVGGLSDLKAGLIRSVGEADVRFHRDPVRVLRAVRHAARAGFTLTPETQTAVEEHRAELALCPESRIRDELLRDLKGGASAAWLELAHQTGVLYSLLPNLEPIYAPPQSPERETARRMLALVDQEVAQGGLTDEAMILAAMLWPALEAKAAQVEFAPSRVGRVQWALFVREMLPYLGQPVAFAKRVVERACQAGGLMAFVRIPDLNIRLPKKIAQKGYFIDACRLARLLGHDLEVLAGTRTQHDNPERHRRPRRLRPVPVRFSPEPCRSLRSPGSTGAGAAR